MSKTPGRAERSLVAILGAHVEVLPGCGGCGEIRICGFYRTPICDCRIGNAEHVPDLSERSALQPQVPRFRLLFPDGRKRTILPILALCKFR